MAVFLAGRWERTAACLMALALCAAASPARSPGYMERTERFDRAPGWEAVNNRATDPAPRTVRQDFGFSPTAHAGRGAGEIGGFITPDATPAFYARKIPNQTLDSRLSASGVLACTGRKFHLLLGFFNSGTLNEWRTPNSIALRIQGRGDYFYLYLEYANRKWRAGGDSPQGFTTRDPATGRQKMLEFAVNGTPHKWSLQYDPDGAGGAGAITATIDDRTAVCNLEPGHRAEGAAFNRIGMLNIIKSVDDGGEVWLDDITVNGETERFGRDPHWEGVGNRRSYLSSDVRPRFDFGFSGTRFAGGNGAGELGGTVYRGDGRYRNKMAWYADRLPPLTLDKPLHASGRVSLRRGVSDSTTLIGFFNSATTTAIRDAQDTAIPDDFMGVAIEGPSSEGFFLYPVYRLGGEGKSSYGGFQANRIYPDGAPHDFRFEYSQEGNGSIRVSFGRQSLTLELGTGRRAVGTRFDRFGIVTTRIDGNAQRIYFDDLTYTCRQE